MLRLYLFSRLRTIRSAWRRKASRFTGIGFRRRKSARLHLYFKGGHGFGMRKQHLPSDHWIERFADWLDTQGLLGIAKK